MNEQETVNPNHIISTNSLGWKILTELKKSYNVTAKSNDDSPEAYKIIDEYLRKSTGMELLDEPKKSKRHRSQLEELKQQEIKNRCSGNAYQPIGLPTDTTKLVIPNLISAVAKPE